MAAYRLAPALVTLRAEVNARWPRRDTASDGWIGDAAHSSRVSQHNPDDDGDVTALDIDTDGIEEKALLSELIGDPRAWYVIHDRVIWSRTYGWRPRRYTGSNPHTGHVHVSLVQTRAAKRNTDAWFAPAAPKPKPRPPAPPTIRNGSRTVRPGDRGPDVLFLKRWFTGRTDVSDVFGPLLAAKVKAWKRMHRLPADSIVGPRAWRLILGGK